MKKLTVKKDADIAVIKVADNYENHPFFVKKNEDAKALLQKVGLPENYKLSTGKAI